MFYDFNRHKRLATSENKAPEGHPFLASLQHFVGRIPEKIKMPLLILFISLTGVGFFMLIIDGITRSGLPEFSASQSRQFYRKSPMPIETYLDSLERAYIQDSLSDSSPKLKR